MKYLECRASDKNIYPKEVLLMRAKISNDLFEDFIEWQKFYNPTVNWAPICFIGKSKYWALNMRSCVHKEWTFNKKWELK